MGIGLVVWCSKAQASASGGIVVAHGQHTAGCPGRAMHHAHADVVTGDGIVGVPTVGHGLHGLTGHPQLHVPSGQPSLLSWSAIRSGSQV